MKRILTALLLFYGLVIGATAYAQSQYDSNFVGPRQEDPFTQYGSTETERCGPQFNGDYILCESLGGLVQQRQTNFAAFLQEMYNLAFILAGTVAFVRIVYGGVLYSWSGVIDQKKKAIGIFWNVATGIALLMGSYAVLNTINPALTILALPNVTMIRPQKAADQAPSNTARNPYAPSTDDLSPEQTKMLDDIENNKTLTEDIISTIEETPAEKRSAEENKRLATLKKNLSSLEAQSKNLKPQPGSGDNLLRDMYQMNLDQMKPASRPTSSYEIESLNIQIRKLETKKAAADAPKSWYSFSNTTFGTSEALQLQDLQQKRSGLIEQLNAKNKQ